MAWKKDKETVVYWYHLPIHTDITTEGYVGVTNNQKQRHWEHVKGSNTGCYIMRRAFEKYGEDGIVKDVVFIGTREECLAKELELRPTNKIGWNIVPGGGDAPDCTGKKHSEETKAKIAAGNKGKNLGKVSPFKGKSRNYSDATKEAIGAAQRGKTISEEHRKAITEKLSGGNSPKARYIVMCHEDSPEVEVRFESITEAAEYTGVSSSALKSTVRRKSLSYNKKGWKVLFDKSHPELGQQ